MTLLLTEDQTMLRDAVRRFVAERAPVSCLRELRDRQDSTGFDRAVWREMAELGCAGVLVPEHLGGTGFGFVGAGLVAQEIGRHLSVTPLLSTAVASVSALLKGASQAQQEAWLPKIAGGDVVMALATDEQSRHAPLRIATRAVHGREGWMLNGVKIHVLDGHVADRLIVSARVSGSDDTRDGIALFLVDPASPGVTIERVGIVDSHNAATIRFDQVKVSASDQMSQAPAADTLDAALEASRVILAAELLGIAEEALERTLAYLREREQFGVLIGSFQALQHRAAHLFCEIELVRSAVLKALQMLEAGEREAARYIALAKAKAGEVARLATNEAVQMHGGIGMTDEFDIGFFMKRARTAAETFGDAYFCSNRFAEFSGY